MAKAKTDKRGDRRPADGPKPAVPPPSLQDVIEGPPPRPRSPNAYVEDQMRKQRKAADVRKTPTR